MREPPTTDRVAEIAHAINAALPDNYRHALEAERRHVEKTILEPRGADERTVMLVGGAGYIGTVIAPHLLDRGYRVRVFDNLIFGHGLTVVPQLSHPRYEFLLGDLTDADQFNRALDGVTDVVLLAGLVGDPITKKYPAASKRINDDGHELMLKHLKGRGLHRVIFVSTCSNYGLIEGDQLADEDFELNPLSLYANSKVRVEQTLLSEADQLDYTPTVLRFATAFGLSARMRFDLTVSEFTRALFLGEELLVYDSHTWRPYCHLQDFAEVIRRVLEAPRERIAGQVFNAGGDVNNYTKQMIVDAIVEQVPNAKIRYQEHGADPRNYRVDFTRIRETLHFEPSHTVPDGIRELVSAMRQGLFHDISQPTSFYGNWVLPDETAAAG